MPGWDGCYDDGMLKPRFENMKTLLLEEVKHAPAEVVPLTVQQYHRMLETGILAVTDSGNFQRSRRRP